MLGPPLPPNANAIKNGRGLVAKGKFVALHKSADGTLLFGECRGSGKSNYQTSCDFIRPGAVTYRCSCPSRQFPCKHCIGLMYAFVDGKTFTEAAVPDDIVSKREKFAKKASAAANLDLRSTKCWSTSPLSGFAEVLPESLGRTTVLGSGSLCW